MLCTVPYLKRLVQSSVLSQASFESCGIGLVSRFARQAQVELRGMASGGDLKWTPPADADRAGTRLRDGTADLCDVYLPDSVDVTVQRKVQIVNPGAGFRDFGGKLRFNGQISTIQCFENNPLVRQAAESSGNGRVLVVDGGASLRCALLGDNVALAAQKNGWSGIIINGCIRDSEDISRMHIGVKALGTHPLKSSKRDPGLRDVPVTFGGVTFSPGDFVYADRDGILVSKEELKL